MGVMRATLWLKNVFRTFHKMSSQDTQLNLKEPKKMHLKMSSAANNKPTLPTNLSMEANNVDPDLTALIGAV